MWSAGYEKIIGLRDMYSREYREMSTVISNEVNDLFTNTRIEVINARASKPDKIKMCFAIMETEAWFLGLHEALEKIHNQLTNEFIFNNLGVDLIKIDPEKEVFHPASLLERIYGLVDENYQKHKGDIEALTHHFDREAIETLLERDKCNSFNVFHNAIHTQ